ncbi:hypothetical protein HanRHA438_Chr08g0344351 [Helianthus annuus]|nr:hypothetical protein HanHA300_Chr08g0275001 [Helianthus annuus]KAJ0546321.1 hypothetical protein HanIR_Chr08g0359601 [Helianthus annuus]KAJ0553073.1 hypothetical protein HanHA89_Chr08g0292331 [Helianthus annuus]KAJ0721991.1 hypothetical protein HanOQP8_Chr08g0281651 [Helianthus annuus]KAJ0897317.1 hypothetical protein HanRHA438_Chr08g0344351 [Helianthus annuus]
MRASSSVGLGLSLVFGCLLLALVAELYYLLWWKKTVSNREMIQQSYSSPAREFLYMFCWKKPSSLTSTGLTTDTQVHEPQIATHVVNHHPNVDIWFRPFGQEQEVNDTVVDSEELRLQNQCVPPRFLFTIKEETKEDLESEDVSKIGSRRMSDVISLDTPFFTPLASPPYFTPPITPGDYSYRTFSPLFQSSTDSEFNRLRASPPPKFKFLRDAEDKLQRKMMKTFEDDDDVIKDEENDSFITLTVSKERDG